MRLSKPLPPERSDRDHLDLERLVFRFDKIHYGRLRALIDALNRLGGNADGADGAAAGA
jgi:hypothetical protein